MVVQCNWEISANKHPQLKKKKQPGTDGLNNLPLTRNINSWKTDLKKICESLFVTNSHTVVFLCISMENLYRFNGRSKTTETHRQSSFCLSLLSVYKHVSVYGRCCIWKGGGQWAACHSEPTDRAPSGCLRPALGWDPVAERCRLKRGSDGPTGTQLLCRSVGSFTACQITHNPVLTGASQELLMPTLPCQGHFTARREENNALKMLFKYKG